MMKENGIHMTVTLEPMVTLAGNVAASSKKSVAALVGVAGQEEKQP